MEMLQAVWFVKNRKKKILELRGVDEIKDLTSNLNSITETVINSQKQVSQSEKIYGILYKESPNIYCTINNENIIIDCNKAYASELGYTREEAIGHPADADIAPQDRAKYNKLTSIWNETSQKKNTEIWFMRKDGTVFPTLLGFIYTYDENGKINGRSEYVTNITDLHNARKIIVKKTDQLEKIKYALDESSLVSITDAGGNITYVNKKFCDVSKYSKEELIGQNHRILKSGFHSPEFYKNIWKTITSGKIWNGEIKNRAKDGTFYWVKTTIAPFWDGEKNKIEYISIRTDITEQKELQEKLVNAERLRSIGEISARLAHDLRNPLSVIKNTIEIMKIKNNTQDEASLEYFSRIDRSISRISHQIEEVMDFVRIAPLELNSCSLLEIIKEVTNKISKSPNIEIILPENDVEMICDSKKFEIVFINLITNAIQAIGDKGKITTRITDDKVNTYITIEDSGSGIPNDILPKIFEPLFTTKQTGTGLGLLSCKNIVEQHNGTITVKNNPTTFTVTIPKAKAPVLVRVL